MTTPEGDDHNECQNNANHNTEKPCGKTALPRPSLQPLNQYAFYLRLIVFVCILYLKSDIAEANSIRRQVPVTYKPTAPAGNSNVTKFKFTLLSGKFWKFNTRSSALTIHQQTESRLYKIIHPNNYTIDDDFWFQYDSQQQQFIAWPSLQTIPGTYQFALLPPGLDFESTENNEAEQNFVVVANIIVELIRPLHQSMEVTDGDLNHLLDHKFSLGFLHRRSNYPLLLQQIVAVLEVISTRDRNNPARSPLESGHGRLIQDQNRTSVLRSRGTLQASRLGEYILISSSYTSDGEYFSISWSYHKSLANNTISQLRECSMSIINSTVARLSISPPTALVIVTTPSRSPMPVTMSRLNAREGSDDLFVHYKLDAPISRLQPIIPTERGGYALKLTLGRPCQSARVLNELGLGHLTEEVKKK